MTEIVDFPFQNPLEGCIEFVDLEMCEAIVSLQKNQTFFHKIVNLATRMFRSKQKSDELQWFDLIKVYLNVPIDSSFVMSIDETSDKQVCVPLGLLLDITELSNTSLPLSLVFDVATQDPENGKRGLMYEWVHTDTKEVVKSLLEVGIDVDTQIPNGYFNSEKARVISRNKNENVALLTEAVVSNLKKLQNEQFKKSLILSALNTTLLLSTNEYSLVDEFDQTESAYFKPGSEVEDFPNFDLLELWNWMVRNLEFTGLIGSFDDFIEYARNCLKDDFFLKEKEDVWVWLNTIFCNTEEDIL